MRGGNHSIQNISKDEYLLVVNKHEDTLAYVNPRSLEVESMIEIGHDPHEMAITPDGRRAYISNYAPPGNTISLIDLVKRTHLLQIPTGRYARIHGAAMAPGGEHAYFTAGQTGYLVEVDTRTNSVSREIPTHGKISHVVAISPNGNILYTANIETRNVSVIDRESGALITQVKCDKGCEGLAFTPDGRFLWAANQQAGSITIIDLSDHRVAKSLKCPGVPLRIKFTSDGKLALVTSWEEKGELVLIDAQGPVEVKRLAVGNQPIGVEISRDEGRAFVSNMSSDDIHVIDLELLEVSGKFVTGRGPDAMAYWSMPRK